MRVAVGSVALLAALACASGRSQPGPRAPREVTRADGDVTIRVRPDGTFEPSAVEIREGSTVTWEFADRYRDSVAPLKSGFREGDDPCSSFAPYEPGALTGPMPRNPSGLFVLNQDGPGLVEVGGKLEASGALGAVMDSSWESPNNVGAFIRLRWNWLQPDGEGRYDWSVLDREVDKAVRSGKLFSVGVKAGFHGTPDWIFGAGIERLTFREYGTHGVADADCGCGAFLEIGDPTDERYQELYLAMLEAMAEHLKSNAAWYRALAYVKPSGANLYSAENRLPKRCTCAAECPGQSCKVPRDFQSAPNLSPDGRICNTKVWAEAGYTPEGLYRFYDRQHDGIARWYPDKDMAYLLIHDGFPRVASRTDYLECGEGREARGVPEPTEQTRQILRRAWDEHRERFSIMHAGLRPDKAVNNLLRKEAEPTQNVGLQTVNDLDGDAQLDATLRNGFEGSTATFVEAYEGVLWQAERAGSKVPERWNRALHQRRQQGARGDGALRQPFPASHRYTFREAGTIRYANPYRCAGPDSFGVIRVVD